MIYQIHKVYKTSISSTLSPHKKFYFHNSAKPLSLTWPSLLCHISVFDISYMDTTCVEPLLKHIFVWIHVPSTPWIHNPLLAWVASWNHKNIRWFIIILHNSCIAIILDITIILQSVRTHFSGMTFLLIVVTPNSRSITPIRLRLKFTLLLLKPAIFLQEFPLNGQTFTNRRWFVLLLFIQILIVHA